MELTGTTGTAGAAETLEMTRTAPWVDASPFVRRFRRGTGRERRDQTHRSDISRPLPRCIRGLRTGRSEHRDTCDPRSS